MQFERHIVFWIAAFAVFAGLLWLLSPILLPFVVGMALAYVLDPLANRLKKRGVSRLAAAVIILGGFVLAFVALLLVVAPVLAKQFVGFVDNAPGYAQRLQGLLSDPNYPWLKRLVGDNLGGQRLYYHGAGAGRRCRHCGSDGGGITPKAKTARTIKGVWQSDQ